MLNSGNESAGVDIDAGSELVKRTAKKWHLRLVALELEDYLL